MAHRRGGIKAAPSFWKYLAAGAAGVLIIGVFYFLFLFSIGFRP
jgi:hypothetical protein